MDWIQNQQREREVKVQKRKKTVGLGKSFNAQLKLPI
jgi:hypothetical protein